MVLEENHKLDRIHKILIKIKGSAIIYVRSRKVAYEFSKELNKLGISSLFYHAGLSVAERDDNQAKWMNNSVRVIVATNAFGMGIDKPDVRTVIHFQHPDTMEAYFQEAGRAGRDGIIFPIRIDCSKSKISVIDDAGELSVVDLVESHNTGTKDMLKSKWKEIMSK